MSNTTGTKLPTMDELVLHSEESLKQNALMVLLNQAPPAAWVKKHPTVDSLYLPIQRVEYLLSRIFTKWWVEVKTTELVANSMAVTVRLFVVNPITGETDFNDGVGAAPIQTDKGAAATDWTKIKSAGIQMALPIAESFAIKDAAEKFGKIFGKDLNRKDEISYTSLLKDADPATEKFADKIKRQAENMSPEHAKVAMTEQEYTPSTNGVKVDAGEEW